MLEIKTFSKSNKTRRRKSHHRMNGGDEISEYRGKVEEWVCSIKDDNKYFTTHKLKWKIFETP